MYKEAAQAKKITATAALDDAISAYTKGFEFDPRDHYPGINAISLLIQKGDAEALKEVERLVPLVTFAVARRGGRPRAITGMSPQSLSSLVSEKIGRRQLEYFRKRSSPRRISLKRQRPLAICVY